MKTRKLEQDIFINATPHEIYEALMDSRKHSKFTEGKAKISKEVGGKFTIDDGYITGTNVELILDKKIVQAWRADEDNWPKKHFSTITIILNEEKEGTKLEFTQEGVPEECYESISKGWQEYYWDPLRLFVEKK